MDLRVVRQDVIYAKQEKSQQYKQDVRAQIKTKLTAKQGRPAEQD